MDVASHARDQVLLIGRAGARKEFGPLSEEIKVAAAKSLGTKSFGAALKQLSRSIKSKTLEETVSFFSQAMKSGGRLAMLLQTSALDLRRTQEMKPLSWSCE